MSNVDLQISKIFTGVPGFDDLFFGGLRLPAFEEEKDRDGICIVIYGERGVSKSDLAMQIMRGVDEFLRTKTVYRENKIRPRYTTLNHRESELKKKYVGFEVSRLVDEIIFSSNIRKERRHVCELCKYFPELKKTFASLIYSGSCNYDTAQCPICNLMSHEVINYSDNSQTINWTYGRASGSSNLISKIDHSHVDSMGIFDSNKNHPDTQYSSSAFMKFKEVQKEIYEQSKMGINLHSKRTENIFGTDFKWSSYVIEGFTAFSDEDLKRLPLNDLITRLRKTTAVSILVFDERGAGLHLNADILIHMRFKTDEIYKYSYYQLQIVKSDLQQHAHGWHLYRKQRDLSVKIHPSMHYLLHRRFASDYAIQRLEQSYMLYPQTLREKADLQFAKEQISDEDNYSKVKVISELLYSKENRGIVYQECNKLLDLELIESEQEYNDLIYRVINEVTGHNTTSAFFLLGKSEQYMRRKLSKHNIPIDGLKNIKVWESGMGCIWAEEFSSIIKEYINRWKLHSVNRILHIVLDDFANINMFPLLKDEQLLIPVLYNICRNAVMCGGYDGNDRGIKIKLTFVCTDQNIPIYKIINQIVVNQ